MKLILTEDVPNLGTLGDTVVVKPGYGRNYLLPRAMALLATGKASKELQHRLLYLEKLREGKIAIAREKVAKLEALNLEVVRQSGTGGRLFGSVTNRDLLELLKENGFEFERRAVLLLTPIRNVGTHEFTVRVHAEVNVTMKVKVNGEVEEVEAVPVPVAEKISEEEDLDNEIDDLEDLD